MNLKPLYSHSEGEDNYHPLSGKLTKISITDFKIDTKGISRRLECAKILCQYKSLFYQLTENFIPCYNRSIMWSTTLIRLAHYIRLTL